jgi:hypothetical protein
MERRTELAMAFATAAFLLIPTDKAPAQMSSPTPASGTAAQTHPYLGMWVTGDGLIRQELLANGRYDEARGRRASAYQGRYEVKGREIFYWDDSGFTADGVFVDADTLHHGGMVFYREK